MQPEYLSDIGPTCIGSETSGNADGTTSSGSIASSADFPVRTFPMPGKEQDLMEPEAGYGMSLPESFASWSPELSAWKTSQRCLLEGWIRFSGRWPRSGLMRSGIVYRLPPLVPRISGTGFLFSPTATANQLCPSMQKWPSCQITVGTPTAGMAKGTGRSEKFRQGRTPTPVEMAMWPTPNTMDSLPPRENIREINNTRDGRKNRQALSNLREAVVDAKYQAMWPTPTARNAKEGGYPAEHERNTPTLAAVAGGQLNPQWVSWLMGFPVDWCDLPGESQPESQTESTNCDASGTQ